MRSKKVVKEKNFNYLTLAIVVILSLLCLFFCYSVIDSDVVIKLDKPNITIKLNDSFKTTTATATYNNRFLWDKNISNRIKIDNKVDSSLVGIQYIKYYVDYHNKHEEVLQKVTIIDDVAPIITLNETKKMICNEEYKEDGYQAIDNYDGDITSKVEVTKDGDSYKYSVTDNSGNETSIIREIKYNDDVKPTISLKGKSVIKVAVGTNYELEGATASDNCSGDLTSKITIKGTYDVNTIGTYKLDYSVSDSSGNKTTTNRYIVVYDPNNTNKEVIKDRTIYLTFDDGPSAYTSKLLDVLDKYDVKATFFVTNKSNSYNSVIKRMYDSGHAIGLHTYTHVYKQIYASLDAYFDDINKISDKVVGITGYKSYLVRFPGGSSNTVSLSHKGIMTAIALELENRGYKYFDWNVDSNDWRTKDSNVVYNNVVNSMKNSKRTYHVVLQHDTKAHSVNAVENIIKWGLDNGYTFDALDLTSPGAHHTIKN